MKITSENRSQIRARLLARASFAGLASVSAFIHSAPAVHSVSNVGANDSSHSLRVETYEEQDDKEAARIKAQTVALRKTDDEIREEREIGSVSSLEIQAETIAQGHVTNESHCLLLPYEKRKLAADVLAYRIRRDLAGFDAGKKRALWLTV